MSRVRAAQAVCTGLVVDDHVTARRRHWQGGEEVSEAMKRRAAAQQAAAKVLREEMERAERRGEDRICQRVLAIPDSKRYMHSVGHATLPAERFIGPKRLRRRVVHDYRMTNAPTGGRLGLDEIAQRQTIWPLPEHLRAPDS